MGGSYFSSERNRQQIKDSKPTVSRKQLKEEKEDMLLISKPTVYKKQLEEEKEDILLISKPKIKRKQLKEEKEQKLLIKQRCQKISEEYQINENLSLSHFERFPQSIDDQRVLYSEALKRIQKMNLFDKLENFQKQISSHTLAKNIEDILEMRQLLRYILPSQVAIGIKILPQLFQICKISEKQLQSLCCINAISASCSFHREDDVLFVVDKGIPVLLNMLTLQSIDIVLQSLHIIGNFSMKIKFFSERFSEVGGAQTLLNFLQQFKYESEDKFQLSMKICWALAGLCLNAEFKEKQQSLDLIEKLLLTILSQSSKKEKIFKNKYFREIVQISLWTLCISFDPEDKRGQEVILKCINQIFTKQKCASMATVRLLHFLFIINKEVVRQQKTLEYIFQLLSLENWSIVKKRQIYDLLIKVITEINTKQREQAVENFIRCSKQPSDSQAIERNIIRMLFNRLVQTKQREEIRIISEIITTLLRKGVVFCIHNNKVDPRPIINKLVQSERPDDVQTGLEILIQIIYQANDKDTHPFFCQTKNSGKVSLKRVRKFYVENGCEKLCVALVQHQRGRIAVLAERLLALIRGEDLSDRRIECFIRLINN